MSIVTKVGPDARSLLGDAAFIAEWKALCAACPWATAFQSPAFCVTWYESYRTRFTPLLIYWRTDAGALGGLLPLALGAGSRRLVPAGAWQAEYQAWICLPEAADQFPPLAIEAAWRQGRGGLRFQYLSPKVPLDWLASHPLNGRALRQTHRRPVMKIADGKQIAESLAKRGNKTRLRRMEKIGPIDFRRMTDGREMREAFDRICLYYDLRHLAMRGSAPFRNDPFKKQFHLAMLAQPGLLHSTVLLVGGKVAAAHIGPCDADEAMLTLNAHNPLLAAHSPGKFLILFLGRLLAQEGVRQLDLTPGGDPYKERFANTWDEVSTLHVFPGAAARARAHGGARLHQVARRLLARFDIKTQHAAAMGQQVSDLGLLGAARSAMLQCRAWASARVTIHVFVANPTTARLENGGDEGASHNRLEELLEYQRSRAKNQWPSEYAFISSAMRRVEAGEEFFTQVDSRGLQRIGWLNLSQASAVWLAEGELPRESAAGSAVIDLCALPRPGGDAGQMLGAMLAAARAKAGCSKIEVLVRGGDAAGLAAARSLGLRKISEHQLRRLAGRQRASHIELAPPDEDSPIAAAGSPVVVRHAATATAAAAVVSPAALSDVMNRSSCRNEIG